MLQPGTAEPSESSAANPPGAVPMAAIAFININICVACAWGSFSVLLGAVQTRLGIGSELATLSAPALSVSSAIVAPIIGALASRFSLRLILLAGSVCSVCGYLVLAFTASFPLYLLAYGLLLGPGLGIGMILSGTLVTRWFSSGRGKALGIISTPLVISFIPLIANWVLLSHSLTAAYLTLAAISLVSVIANYFIRDFPAGSPVAARAAEPTANGGATMRQLLCRPRFWGLALGYAVGSMSAIMLASHMVPMAKSWGFSATLAAMLLTIQALSGILGSNLYGWIGDRLGGAVSLAVLLFFAALLWLLLLLHLPYIVLAIIIGLTGLNAAGLTPVISLALSQVFGPESFSQAYGLSYFIMLPFVSLSVPAAAVVFTHTGSYSAVIIGQAVLLGLTGLLALTAWRRRAAVLA